MRPLELTGKRFERLTVIERAGPDSRGAICWHCRCDCGKERSFRGSDLKRGFIKSCGCWNSEVTTARNTSHGGSATRLYHIWQAMKNRTQNIGDARAFGYYGARGISVCSEWQQFEPFRAWALANGYADNLSIDRVDNDGNYEPSNCRWADQATQVRNRRPWGTATMRKGEGL